MKRRGSLTVEMDAAIRAWCLRPGASTSAQVAQHALAHGVSASGLWRALKRGGLIAKAAPHPTDTERN